MEIIDKPIAESLMADRLDALAARYRNAGGPIIQLMDLAGVRTEGLADRLPDGLRDNLERGTEQALKAAMKLADGSRRAIGDQPEWLTTAASAAVGAAGGLGGLSTSLAELPATIVILLCAIQAVAVEQGFDPAEPGVKFDCIQVFAAPGPLDCDEGADPGFPAMRIAVTGAAMQALMARVAPRLATVLGQKLAAQAMPVAGALAGGAANYAYARYYREMAHVHFGLRRLAIDADRDHAELIRDIRARLGKE